MPIERTRRMSLSALRKDRLHRKGAEEGAIAIMTPFVLIVMIAMVGMALDLSSSYNRKTELQGLSDAVAMAAASALDGTPAGSIGPSLRLDRPRWVIPFHTTARAFPGRARP